jgi:hypothetical protein
MTHTRSRRVGVFGFRAAALAFALTGCGSPPPAAPPPTPNAVPAAPPPPVASAAPSASAETPPVAAAPAATAPADDSGPTRSQKAIDILTARDAAFLVDYANSDVKQRAEAACAREKDVEKAHACEDKARDSFEGDVIRFKRDPDDRKDWEKSVVLLVYKRSGSALRELSVGTVELSEEGDGAVRVKLGKQKGARPLWRGQPSALITAPNDYSIEFDDPEYGHLRYDAKIGLVTE